MKTINKRSDQPILQPDNRAEMENLRAWTDQPDPAEVEAIRAAEKERKRQARLEEQQRRKQGVMKTLRGLRSGVFRGIRFFMLTLLCYLIQVCAFPYLKIGGTTPNLMVAFIAVSAVVCGWLWTFWAGCVYGIVLEAMVPSVPILNLAMYPVMALINGALFGDKSHRRLEFERSQGKPGRNMNPYLRTVLGAGISMLLYGVLNAGYIYLTGTDLEWMHIEEVLRQIGLTMLLTLIVAPGMRYCLGIRRKKQRDEVIYGTL